jgi:hypothetical protein
MKKLLFLPASLFAIPIMANACIPMLSIMDTTKPEWRKDFFWAEDENPPTTFQLQSAGHGVSCSLDKVAKNLVLKCSKPAEAGHLVGVEFPSPIKDQPPSFRITFGVDESAGARIYGIVLCKPE